MSDPLDHPVYLVPLATIAPDFDCTADQLAHRIGDGVFLNDYGQRCTTRHTAAALFADQAARRAAEARRRAEAAAQPNPIRQRVEAIAANQTAPAGTTLAESALIAVAGPDLAARHNHTASTLDDYLSGESVYHRITPEEQ